MMLTPVRATKFRRDVERMRKRGKHMEHLADVIDLLIEGKPLPPKYRDHALRGKFLSNSVL